MLLFGETNEQRLQTAWASMTFAELRSLKEHLDMLFQQLATGDREPGWHCHIGDGQRELTIEALDPATGYNVTPKMAKLLDETKREDEAKMQPISDDNWLNSNE